MIGLTGSDWWVDCLTAASHSWVQTSVANHVSRLDVTICRYMQKLSIRIMPHYMLTLKLLCALCAVDYQRRSLGSRDSVANMDTQLHVGLCMIPTYAHVCSRVRVPPSIRCTNCPHSSSRSKPWVTSKEYLSALSCVLKSLNGAISKGIGVATVGWREEGIAHWVHYIIYLAVNSLPTNDCKSRHELP